MIIQVVAELLLPLPHGKTQVRFDVQDASNIDRMLRIVAARTDCVGAWIEADGMNREQMIKKVAEDRLKKEEGLVCEDSFSKVDVDKFEHMIFGSVFCESVRSRLRRLVLNAYDSGRKKDTRK